MAVLDETIKPKFHMVRAIYGFGKDRQQAIDNYNFIPDGGMNAVIKQWQDKQPDRELAFASPSAMTRCPRSIWLELKGVPFTEEVTWALKQRLLLGRLFENQFAEELDDAGMLLYHWKDDPGTPVDKFQYGNPGDPTYFEGVPDYLTKLEDGKVYISDAKTSRGDSFGYLPVNEFELFTDGGWYKNRMQLTGYYILCHANPEKMAALGLPMPEGCHLFSYALDDGIVRREARWVPTQADIDKFLEYTRRFNLAMIATTAPDCTCGETPDGFEIKFCKYGVKPENSKVCTSCCDDNLIPEEV